MKKIVRGQPFQRSRSFSSVSFVLFILFLIFNPYTVLAQKKVNIDLEDTRLIDIVKLLSDISGLNIVADDSVKGKKVTMSLKDISALDALDLMISVTGLAYQVVDNKTILISTLEKLRVTSKGRGVGKIHLYYIDAIEAKEILTPYVLEGSDIQINSITNDIIITDVSSQIKKIKEIIDKIDCSPQQVMLEAKVVEVSSSDLKEIGFNWSSAITESIVEGVTTGTTNPSLTDPIKFARTPTLQLTTILNFLATEGKAKILASPKITTLNKKEATIEVTDQVPYATRTFDTAGRETITMASVSVGVSLKITPQVNADGDITVQINPKVSSVIEFAGPKSDFPRVARREAQTIVRVKDGETIILGGLNKNEERESIKKVPLLGDIPFIGLLFKNRRIEKVNTEIVIFITPHLLKEPVLTK